MNRNNLLVAIFFSITSMVANAGSYDSLAPKALLDLPEDKIDLAVAKLVTDKMIDPTIDIKKNLKKLDAMVADMKRPLGDRYLSLSDNEKMMTLLTYIYDEGFWNKNQVFSYDLDDPFGKDIKTKLLPHYLETRKGNCVSMPMLLLILGQKLGLNVALVKAPEHFFIHFTDETGKVFNLEGVGKGTVSDERYRREHLITDEAIENGIYLQSLTKRQAVIEMLTTVAEYYSKNGQYGNVMTITSLMLEHDPKSINPMLVRGGTYWLIGDSYLKAHNYKLNSTEDRYYQKLKYNNNFWFTKAESLGWREQPKEYKDAYVALIQKVKAEQQATEEVGNESH